MTGMTTSDAQGNLHAHDGKFAEKTNAEAPPGVIDIGALKPTSKDFFELKSRAAQASRDADRLGARLVAEEIKSRVPHAAYLLMDESDQSNTTGFWATKILDENKKPIGDIDNDYIIDDAGNEFEIEGIVWEVLTDLPHDAPVVYDQATGKQNYSSEYGWFSKFKDDQAVIDLNRAVAD